MRFAALAASYLVGATFTDHITLGSILVGLILGIIGVFNIIAGGQRWRSVYEAEKERREQTDARLLEVSARETALKAHVARLEALPDLAGILREIGAVESIVRERFLELEQKAQERHEAQLAVNSAMLRALSDILKKG